MSVPMSVRASRDQWEELLSWARGSSRFLPSDAPEVLHFVAHELREREELFG